MQSLVNYRCGSSGFAVWFVQFCRFQSALVFAGPFGSEMVGAKRRTAAVCGCVQLGSITCKKSLVTHLLPRSAGFHTCSPDLCEELDDGFRYLQVCRIVLSNGWVAAFSECPDRACAVKAVEVVCRSVFTTPTYTERYENNTNVYSVYIYIYI